VKILSLSKAIRGTLPKPAFGLQRVETTLRNVEGVEYVGTKDDPNDLDLSDFRMVLTEPERFVALVPVI
jgi:hypothetical protein